MPSTYSVCGTFTERFPDYGQCWPRRGKRNCTEDWDNPDADTPGETCVDPNAYVENTPELVPPYMIISAIFDENCEEILDENGDPILGSSF
jgi:hypothetical protein